MINDTYEKAKEIKQKIEDLRKLRYIATKPYKRFFLIRKILKISDYYQEEVCLCDEGLSNLIREYCDKRIKELREELESL